MRQPSLAKPKTWRPLDKPSPTPISENNPLHNTNFLGSLISKPKQSSLILKPKQSFHKVPTSHSSKSEKRPSPTKPKIWRPVEKSKGMLVTKIEKRENRNMKTINVWIAKSKVLPIVNTKSVWIAKLKEFPIPNKLSREPKMVWVPKSL